jgi:hypothetical protein
MLSHDRDRSCPQTTSGSRCPADPARTCWLLSRSRAGRADPARLLIGPDDKVELSSSQCRPGVIWALTRMVDPAGLRCRGPAARWTSQCRRVESGCRPASSHRTERSPVDPVMVAASRVGHASIGHWKFGNGGVHRCLQRTCRSHTMWPPRGGGAGGGDGGVSSGADAAVHRHRGIN